jgi:hypothetical protein
MVFLHSHSVGTARAVRIFETYGSDTIQVMTQNPYRLARDIRGIAFKTADAIRHEARHRKTAMIRVRAGISYALTEAMDEGHCGLLTEELTPLTEKLFDSAAIGLGRTEHGLLAGIDIVETHDVVFAEIGADLHLDQFERDLSGIGEPVRAADRNIDRVVFLHRADLAVDGDLRRALDHDPVLGAMEMLLQRQLGAFLHDDALDLIARAHVDALIIAPGSIDAPVLDRLAPVLRLSARPAP